MKNSDGYVRAHSGSATALAASNAQFMSKVYLLMSLGVGLSGIIAYFVGNNQALVETILMNRALFWSMIILQVGTVLFLSYAMNRISSSIASFLYFVYAALTGVTLSIIFLIYARESIYSIFGLAAFSFAGLSSIGLVTKRDLGPVGSFCTMGLFGMIGFSILSIFMPDLMGGTAGTVYSLVGITVFAGLTAYDTQKIKNLNLALGRSQDTHKSAIFGALTLYLDFINLFLSLLRLMGRRK
jgi:FtsH-binding integral membrane protein